jgi:hypothetical protein
MADEKSSQEKASQLAMVGFTYLLRAAREDKSIAPLISKAIGTIAKGISKRQVPEKTQDDKEGYSPPPAAPGQTRSPVSI